MIFGSPETTETTTFPDTAKVNWADFLAYSEPLNRIQLLMRVSATLLSTPALALKIREAYLPGARVEDNRHRLISVLRVPEVMYQVFLACFAVRENQSLDDLATLICFSNYADFRNAESNEDMYIRQLYQRTKLDQEAYLGRLWNLTLCLDASLREESHQEFGQKLIRLRQQ